MRPIRLIAVLLALTAFGCGRSARVTAPAAAQEPGLHGLSRQGAAASAGPGAVYVMTNAVAGNAVLAFARSSDGTLSPPVSYATGGLGTGAGLGNQSGLVLTHDGRWLIAVDAGSDELSVFRVSTDGLALAGRVASGGDLPVSVAVHGGRVYALNAGSGGTIHGFRLDPTGKLEPIAGSSRPLSGAGADPAQIAFTPDGRHLVVTERATNAISVYAVNADGTASGPVVSPSSGATPFGFGFDARGTLIVSEAFGGATDASAVSSYRVGAGGALAPVSPSVPTTETSACWIAVTDNGRFAYTANTGSASVTGYAVGADGSLTRLDADGVTATAGAGTNEMAVSAGSRFLFVRNGGANSISAYRIGPEGALSGVAETAGLPAGANGLAAR